MTESRNEGCIRSYLRDFSNGTTLHGVRYVGESNRHWTERLWWITTMALCATICGLQMVNVWMRWKENPAILSFAQRATRSSQIPFPAVTVCPTNAIARDKFEFDVYQKKIDEFLINPSEAFTEEQQQMIYATLQMCRNSLSSILPSHMFDRNESILRTMLNMTGSVDDYIVEYKWKNQENWCGYAFRPIFTDLGICYTFNMKNMADIFKYNEDIPTKEPWWTVGNAGQNVGRLSGLSIVLRYPDISKQICLNRFGKLHLSDIFKVFIHSSSDFPSMDGALQPINVAPWTDLNLQVRPVITTTDPALQYHPPDKRGCRFTKDQQFNIFKHYSTQHCELECAATKFENFYHCRLPYLPLDPGRPNLTYCPVDLISEYPNLVKSPMCKYCLPNCNEIRYEVNEIRTPFEESHLPLSISKYDREWNASVTTSTYLYYTTGKIHSVVSEPERFVSMHKFNASFARLNIYFGDREYIGIHRSEFFSFTDVLSNFGGLLGLFTGFSVVTAIEIIYFATLRLFCALYFKSGRDIAVQTKVEKI